MIRLKSKDADLKRTYARDLWASVGFAVLLLAAVVAIDPQIVFDASRPVQRPVIIEIEPVPCDRDAAALAAAAGPAHRASGVRAARARA